MKRQRNLLTLNPLRPRRSRLSADEYARAVNKLDSRAFGSLLARTLARRRQAQPKPNLKDLTALEEWARGFIRVVRALSLAGNISEAEYAFYCIFPVTFVHEERWLTGLYAMELNSIATSMDSIRKQYGVSDDEDWRTGTGPLEYRKLDREYNRVLERNEAAALSEFGFPEFADLLEEDRKKFRALFERGARAAFDDDAVEPALRDLLPSFVDEAERAGEAGVYAAACVFYCAAMETLLLIRCLRSPAKSYAHAKKVSQRTPSRDPRSWTLEVLIKTCQSAGWLPPLESSIAIHSRVQLAHYLRQLRNLVHPGRMVRDRAWAPVGRDDYETAKAVYQVLEVAFRKT